MTTDPQNEPREAPSSSEEDIAVARETIAMMAEPPAEGTAEHKALVERMAEYRARVGGDRFDLHFGRREPRNGVERLHLRAQCESWDDDRLMAEIKAHVTRDIDAEMLEALFDALDAQIEVWVKTLRAIMGAASLRGLAPREYADHYADIDELVEQLDAKYPLYSTEMRTVHEFLVDVQAENGKLVKYGYLTSDCAAMLLMTAVSQLVAQWRRLRNDYDHDSAAEQFYAMICDCDDYPFPHDLSYMVHMEHVRAQKVLASRLGEQTPTPVKLVEVAPDVRAEVGDLERDAEPAYWPIASFPDKLQKLIEHAGRNYDKGKGGNHRIIRRRQVQGSLLYCVQDVQQYWPREMGSVDNVDK